MCNELYSLNGNLGYNRNTIHMSNRRILHDSNCQCPFQRIEYIHTSPPKGGGRMISAQGRKFMKNREKIKGKKKKVKKREKRIGKAKKCKKREENSVKRRRNKDVSPKFMSLGKKIQKIFHSLYF